MAPVVIYLSTTPSQVSTIGITSSGNTVCVNGTDATIVNDVSGQMVDGNTLEIEVNGVAGQVALPSQSAEITGGAFTSAKSLHDALENLSPNHTITGMFHSDDSSTGNHLAVTFTIARTSNGAFYPSGIVFQWSVNEQIVIRNISISGTSVTRLDITYWNRSEWFQGYFTIDSTCTVNGIYFIS